MVGLRLSRRPTMICGISRTAPVSWCFSFETNWTPGIFRMRSRKFMQAWMRILEGGTSDDRKLLNYLMYMTQRLIRCRDILAPAGSIYFHCDPSASHYLKVIMDGVFGRRHFRSEVTWKRTSAHSGAKRYGPVHDTLLFYTASDSYTWTPQYQPYEPDYVDTFFDQTDPDGRRYKRGDLTGAGIRGGETGQPWREIDITAKGRHWAHPPKVLDKLDAQGLIHWPAKSGMPRLKQYEDESKGVFASGCVDKHPSTSQSVAGKAGVSNSKVWRTHEPYPSGFLFPRRHCIGPLLWMRYHNRNGSRSRHGLDRHRHQRICHRRDIRPNGCPWGV